MYNVLILIVATCIAAVSSDRVAVISSNTSDVLKEFVPFGFDLVHVDTVEDLKDKFGERGFDAGSRRGFYEY